MARGTSEVPVVIELDDTSSPSPRPDENDAGDTHTKADGKEDETATVTGQEQDPANALPKDVQTVKANNQDLPLDSQAAIEIIKRSNTRPISQEQLVAEVRASMLAW